MKEKDEVLQKWGLKSEPLPPWPERERKKGKGETISLLCTISPSTLCSPQRRVRRNEREMEPGMEII